MMQRSFKQERMEDPSLEPENIRNAVKAIDRMNWLLRTFSPFVNEIKKLLNRLGSPLSIVDVGAGSGYLGQYLKKRFAEKINYLYTEPSDLIISVHNSHADKTRLRTRCPELPLKRNSVDICISSLVLHHIDDEVKPTFLKDTLRIANHRVIHHDLLRNQVSYWGAVMLTQIITNSEIARHDGPLSVRRSLTKKEWTKLLDDQLSEAFKLKKSWPWRINLIGKPT